MKKYVLKFVLAATAVVTLATAASAASIVGSKHDLSSAGAAIRGTTDQVCVFCHTPHNGGSLGAPLWNKGTPAGPYTMYSSSTLDNTIGGSPGATSQACLACHDGTLSVGVLTNLNGTGNTQTMTDQAGGASYTAGVMQAGTAFMVGEDLSNDHPIAIQHDEAVDTGLKTLASAKTAGLVYFGAGVDEVECATCHNVHDPANAYFLRISNASSGLCTTCHNK